MNKIEELMFLNLRESAKNCYNTDTVAKKYGNDFIIAVKKAPRTQEIGGLMKDHSLTHEEVLRRRGLVRHWLTVHRDDDRLALELKRWATAAFANSLKPLDELLDIWNGTTRDSAPKVLGVTLSNEGYFTDKEKAIRKLGRVCKKAMAEAGEEIPSYIPTKEVVVEVQPQPKSVQATVEPKTDDLKESIKLLLECLDRGLLTQEQVLKGISKLVK